LAAAVDSLQISAETASSLAAGKAGGGPFRKGRAGISARMDGFAAGHPVLNVVDKE